MGLIYITLHNVNQICRSLKLITTKLIMN